MGQRRTSAIVAAILLSLLPSQRAAAQRAREIETPDEPSQRVLTVWVVRPPTALERAAQRAQSDLKSIGTYRESTAGSFGSSASDAGQTAGSYGTSASNVGRNASDVGQTAGSYGQTAGSLPSEVKSQTAGSYGVTAGSIGTNASDYTGVPAKVAVDPQLAEYLLRTRAWQTFTSHARSEFFRETVTFTEVPGLELPARLAEVVGTPAYPDVLLLPATDFPKLLLGDQAGELTAEQVQELIDRVALVHVGRPFPLAVVRASDTAPKRVQHLSKPFGHALGLVRAPHPRITREFLEWLAEEPLTEFPPKDIGAGTAEALPVEAAVRVTESLFSGGTAAAWADPQMAQFTLAEAASILYVPQSHVPGDLHAQTGVIAVEANERLAVVLLDAEVISRHAYGRFFPLMILRRTDGGAWKVLHASLDLPEAAAADAFKLLANCLEPESQKQPAKVVPVSLAAPKDGEQRAAQAGLELWWDDTSNARVLVIEYQDQSHASDGQPHLFVIDDREAKLQTRAAAPFGNATGPLRWRVWSVGQGGNVQITPWQRLTLIR